MFKVKFWGVRGSIACPGPKTAKYGGNTSSIEIITDQDYRIVIDFGTGCRALGANLFSSPDVKKPLRIYAFLSHTHWDHIMGFPFFGPIHAPSSVIDIYGPVPLSKSLEEIVGGQLTYEYFPVNFTQLQSTINYHELKEGSMELPGGLKVSYQYLNHPILCLGYRFEYQGKVISTCYDHEPFLNLFADDPDNCVEGQQTADESNKRISDFFAGSDILVHDAQYTSKEYKNFTGWGHSTYKYAITQAMHSGVKKLVLFHHDPDRTDAKLDVITKKCGEKFNTADFKVMPAYEGLELDA